jgi:hypothetical protein
MKLEVKNVKVAKFASQETLCFDRLCRREAEVHGRELGAGRAEPVPPDRRRDARGHRSGRGLLRLAAE